jgi:hypothetical protein
MIIMAHQLPVNKREQRVLLAGIHLTTQAQSLTPTTGDLRHTADAGGQL